MAIGSGPAAEPDEPTDLQAQREAGATGLEPATSGVIGHADTHASAGAEATNDCKCHGLLGMAAVGLPNGWEPT